MKRRGIIYIVLLLGLVMSASADAPVSAAPAEGISIAAGFQKLWKETGIYRFLNPLSADEKEQMYYSALEKTVDAQLAAGNFSGVVHVLDEAAAYGVEESTLAPYRERLAEARLDGYTSKGLLPEGLGQFIMIFVGIGLIYLAIAKGFEPLLLLPIGFGTILTNIPVAGIAGEPMPGQPGGFLYYFYSVGVESGVFPLLIFMGVGAMTDFGPLLANPKTALLGAAAQFGIFLALLGAVAMGGLFSLEDAAAIGIIGGADGPTAIFLASRLARIY